jgi:inorganic pyrophosphatase
MSYYTKAVSVVGTREFRVFLMKEGLPVSPFHDVPLWADEKNKIANFLCEIPRGERAKLEISRVDPLNPIKQDEKKGKLRQIHDPYPFNYGAFPQTWENPLVIDAETQCKGDLDPLDVCDIGSKVHRTGEVVQVKILGTWAMIDEGETDWKVLVIDVTDPDASKYNDASDVPRSVVERCFTFLRDYKIPDGNPPNKFAFNGELKGRQLALVKIEEMHKEWKRLITGQVPAKSDKYEYSILNTTLDGHPGLIKAAAAEDLVLSCFKTYVHAKQ